MRIEQYNLIIDCAILFWQTGDNVNIIKLSQEVKDNNAVPTVRGQLTHNKLQGTLYSFTPNNYTAVIIQLVLSSTKYH